MNKNLLRILVVVALGALLAAGFYIYDLKKHPAQQQQFSIDKKDLAAAQLPKGFPSNLPIEAGSQVLQNYEVTTTDGRFQSDRVMTTSKTLAQVVKIYNDFFAKLGWDVIPATNPDDNTVIAQLRKGNDTVLIVARNNSDTKQKTVEITLTQAPK